MPRIKYTKENMPKKPGEMVKTLKEAALHTTPLDDLLELNRDLVKMEIKYKMPSDELYRRYKKGEMGDAMEIMQWASRYDRHQKLKLKLERVLQQHYAEPAIAL